MGRSVSTPTGAQVIVYVTTESSYYCRTCANCREVETYVNPDGTCPRCKVKNRNADIQFDDDTTRMNWEDDLMNLQDSLVAAFPSLRLADRWMGREDHVILENALAAVTVSEYCGLVAVCLVPDKAEDFDRHFQEHPLSVQWINSAERSFRRGVSEVFGCELSKMGTMSNGESVFKQVGA